VKVPTSRAVVEHIVVGPDRECVLTGSLSNKDGRVSGEIEIAFVLKDNGTDRLLLSANGLERSRLNDLVTILMKASLAPFTKRDKSSFAWQYYSAECHRNRSAAISRSPGSKSVTVEDALDALARLSEYKP
jgi:hypothetical protein